MSITRAPPGVARPGPGAWRAGRGRVRPAPAEFTPAWKRRPSVARSTCPTIASGKKIRNASKSKAPFILIVGEEDMNNNAVSFRFRDGSQLNGVPVDEAKANILTVIKKRVQVNTADDFKAALAD